MPKKPLPVVAPDPDRAARLLQEFLQENKIVIVPVIGESSRGSDGSVTLKADTIRAYFRE